jgi:hypothetical protein
MRPKARLRGTPRDSRPAPDDIAATGLLANLELNFGAPDWSPITEPTQYVGLANLQDTGHANLRASDKLANRS